jgi:SAM-dependent methyltransferase
MKLLKHFSPQNGKNLLSHVGDLENARRSYTSRANQNLWFLLETRFSWMNDFILPSWVGLEVGSGIGASKDFIRKGRLKTSDYSDYSWLDLKYIDAVSTGLPSNSFDFIIASNVIHHLAFPAKFLDECDRLLKPGGRLIVQEIETSILMRMILRFMNHEGFDELIDVFDSSKPCNNPEDAWSANCSIPKLLFGDSTRFENHFPRWKKIHDIKTECILFLNSGGVVAKVPYIPLPRWLLKCVRYADRWLLFLFGEYLSLQRRIVIEKI